MFRSKLYCGEKHWIRVDFVCLIFVLVRSGLGVIFCKFLFSPLSSFSCYSLYDLVFFY